MRRQDVLHVTEGAHMKRLAIVSLMRENPGPHLQVRVSVDPVGQ